MGQMLRDRASLLLLLHIFIVVGALAACPAARGADEWVFLGDSITVGMVGSGRTFVDEVRQRYGVEVQAVNTSRVGKHVTEYVAEIDGILRSHPRARYFPFLIGGNDVSGYSASRAAWLRTKLVTVLDKIVAAGRVPILMRMTYQRLEGDPRGRYNVEVYDGLIRQYSPRWFDETTGRGLVDVHGWVSSHQQYLARDGVHLSPTGYREARAELLVRIMAGVVYGNGATAVPVPSTSGAQTGTLTGTPSGPVDMLGQQAGAVQTAATVQTVPTVEQAQVRAVLTLAEGLPATEDKAFAVVYADALLSQMAAGGRLQSDEVRRLQEALAGLGANPGPIDSVYGPRTRAAATKVRVALAQRHVRALGFSPGPIDGIEGPRTRAALQAYWASRGVQRPANEVSLGEVAALRAAVNGVARNAASACGGAADGVKAD